LKQQKKPLEKNQKCRGASTETVPRPRNNWIKKRPTPRNAHLPMYRSSVKRVSQIEGSNSEGKGELGPSVPSFTRKGGKKSLN